MSTMVFTYTRGDLLNKRIEVDEQGWYKVNLGAINAFNAHGAFYLQDGVSELLYNPESRLAQKLENGYLIGEMEHPKLSPHMSNEEVFMTVSHINRENQSHHIKKIEIVDTGVSPGKGFPGTILQLVGWVKPCGPKGQFLKECLDDPEMNTAFSVRALTSVGRVGVTEVRKIESIITFDWVTEPGIPSANKFDTQRVSIESYNNLTLNSIELPYKYSLNDIQNIANKNKTHGNVNMESDTMGILRDIKVSNNSKYSKVFKQW